MSHPKFFPAPGFWGCAQNPHRIEFVLLLRLTRLSDGPLINSSLLALLYSKKDGISAFRLFKVQYPVKDIRQELFVKRRAEVIAFAQPVPIYCGSCVISEWIILPVRQRLSGCQLQHFGKDISGAFSAAAGLSGEK